MTSSAHRRIVVALSGGVDSSVSAALLKEKGYEVEGAFIKTWTAPWLPCTWREERRDAMRVASHLHIPFHTVDLSDEYETQVVSYMVREYREGRTPNPDVMCNKHIKFGAFFDWAMDHGFDAVATGHYAQNIQTEHEYELHAGKDTKKDQTYFLWTLTQHHLARTMFPVGGLIKSEVRDHARRFNLSTAEKKDSQGICFLGKVNMKEFLSHYIEPHPGDVLDQTGHRIGTHEGAVFLTIGQRHGFTVHQSRTDAEPLYVVDKDIVKNTITVAPRGATAMPDDSTIHIHDTNWIGGIPPAHCDARLRYRQTLFPVQASCTDADNRATVIPQESQPYVPIGQSMVLYHGSRCLGGGIVE